MTERPSIDGAAYDYDRLVFEDRVHRVLYTDPRIFDQEMTRIFGAVWVYLGHESQIPQPDDFVTARLGRRPIILVRDSRGVLRALYNRCTHRGLDRLPRGARLGEVLPVRLSRLDLPELGQAQRRALAGRLRGQFRGREVQPRPGAPGRELSRLRLRHAQPRCAFADRLSRRRRRPARRMARPPPRRQGRAVRGQPAQVQGQLEAALRQLGRRLPRRVLASLAARHGEPLRCGRRQGDGVLPARAPTRRRCMSAASATATTSRTSAPMSRTGRARCGRSRARTRAWSISRPRCASASATGPTGRSTSPRRSR